MVDIKKYESLITDTQNGIEIRRNHTNTILSDFKKNCVVEVVKCTIPQMHKIVDYINHHYKLRARGGD